MLGVPLLRDGVSIGVIALHRKEVRPFTDKQIELVQSFASQAVIAIENTRLLNELRESLQQQTATADVLKVISRSTFDLQTVLDTLVESAARLCDADQATIRRRVGDQYPIAATYGLSQEQRDHLERYPPKPDRGSAFGRALVEGRTVHIPDVAADPEFGRPQVVAILGSQAAVGVPLQREGVVVGVLVVMRKQPGSFSPKQIELLETFADQAVIAIENVRLFDEVQARTREVSEALEQQTATAEVLRVISSSPGELEPVFNAMLENATRICEAKFGVLWLVEGDGFRAVALHGALPEFAEERRRNPVIRPAPGHNLARMARTKAIVHIADISADEQAAPVLAKLTGARTCVYVPMLKDDRLIGAIVIYRQEVRPFTDKQIELVANFAAQAVIAIENTRLLNELRKSLQQQTATAEVLQVISSSPGELAPVFQTMLANAVHLCEAKFGNLWLREREGFRIGATHGAPPEYRKRLQETALFSPGMGTGLAGLLKTKRPFQIADLAASPGYLVERNPLTVASVELGGTRTLFSVPMLKEGEVVGSIAIYRQEVRPFTDKQIELVSNFAKQAVIAIENTRLLNELRQRTDDLSETLEQQTATSEVLQVISRSPGALEPVFNSMLENAVQICDASFGNLLLYDGNLFRHVALHNAPAAWATEQQRDPVPPRHAARVLYSVADTKQVTHIADMVAKNPDEPIATIAGARTVLIVPMLKEAALIGVIAIYRQEVRPFGDKQIELVQNFAAQAVIAIENTRLLNELRQRTDDLSESLQQQTATAEVLRVISSTPADLQPVFEAILANATRICEAKFGNLWLREGDAFRLGALHGAPAAFAEARWREPVLYPKPNIALGRVFQTNAVVQVQDIKAEPAYAERDPARVALVELAGARSYIMVPMLKEKELVGAIGIYRQEVRPFTDKQIELVTNFAAQAVIAIENARLLNETA